MKIISYHYKDIEDPGWDFSEVQFDKINLLVGDTATGKSRFLYTIFNLGRFVASKEFKQGQWDIEFEHLGTKYSWHLKTRKLKNDKRIIIKDNLFKYDNNGLIKIIERNDKEFYFQNIKIPKLSLQETSISLLNEENIIKPIYDAFTLIQRRLFYKDALNTVTELRAIPMGLIQSLEEDTDINKLLHANMNLSVNLYILHKYFKNIYDMIVDYYKQVFPFIKETRMTDLAKLRPNIAVPGNIPVFIIKEHKSNKWIPVDQLSSGMQKTLLILTDIFILPEGSVYLIDEYENSLGLNAIDFFPQFVLDLNKEVQFFITSHHPYIINEIPPINWFVFHREGMKVFIKYGNEIIEKYGKSKQKAFIQLINDPFFARGVQ